MNIGDALVIGLKMQGTDFPVEDICFNVIMKEEYMLNYCFLLHEDDETLIITATTEEGTDEVRIVPKENILYVQLVYEIDELFFGEEEGPQDRMYS